MQRKKILNRFGRTGNIAPSSFRSVFVRNIGAAPTLYSTQKPCGMTSVGTGFTLIELLVVVLIIGILAAVALPQYKFAVAKARMIQLVTMANSIKQAEERYYLANGEYTTDFTVLDVDVQGTISSNNKRILSPSGWNAELGSAKVWVSLWDERINGVRLYWSFDDTPAPGAKQCYALTDNALANDLCKHFTRRTSHGTDGMWSVYYWYD